ncbi:photosynthetic complex assembly protein PuhC [Tranquillimonas alkanivorans]|uniref:Photosynthetic complex assembly protein n=1 Tax=Tranquillimonas alkanivorans TaxID=441119 RepID=A0A1I5MYG8_9RHOB|nr:photosynthetic complex assembly protein PuhC [Tranquillimonas alkanivorans]SFP14573.1 hypothetical protein SAMN04488047_10310 [Tranquillimonas alkanivorans]
MSDEPTIVTPGTLGATFGLMALAVGIAVFSDRPAPAAGEAPAASRTLVFAEKADGGMDILNRTGALVDSLVVQGDLFAITAVRGVAGRVGPEDPQDSFSLELRRMPGGDLLLFDPGTGKRLDLSGFGVDNRAALAQYLSPRGRSPL